MAPSPASPLSPRRLRRPVFSQARLSLSFAPNQLCYTTAHQSRVHSSIPLPFPDSSSLLNLRERSHTHLLATSSLCLLLRCLWFEPCKWVLCEDGQDRERWRVLGKAGEFFDGSVREAGFRRCWSARGGFFAGGCFLRCGCGIGRYGWI